MKVARKLLTAGGVSLVLAGGIVALPTATSVGATYNHGNHGPGRHADHNKSFVLKEESNAAYTVKTVVNPDKHVLWTTVTNKTDSSISPTVTFNGEQGVAFGNKPIDPGKSQKYFHLFTGNNFNLDVTVTANGVEPFTSSALVNLQETVSFQATAVDPANKAVTGTLTNNTATPQTVYVKTHKKNKTTESLAANESRMITISTGSNSDKRHYEPRAIWVTFAVQGGAKSSYIIPLDAKAVEEITPQD